MKYRRITLDEVPTEGLKLAPKGELVEQAEYIYLVTRDEDDSKVLLFGTHRFTPMSVWRTIWIIPYEGISWRDWRGIKKLFAEVRKYTPYVRALVRKDEPMAINTVKKLGATWISEWSDEDDLYQWGIES